MARTAEAVDLPLRVGRPDGGDLREQVAEQVRSALRAGAFAPGQRLPSSRALATHLRVSRATVVAAMAELDGEGWVVSRQGSGTYVSDDIELSPPEAPAGRATPASGRARRAAGDLAHRRVDLTPGMPDTTRLVDPSWRRAWREAASAWPASGDPDPAGEVVLRAALAAHVRRARGIACSAEQVVVTAGTGDGVRLLADATGLAGGVAVVEEPGYTSAREVLRLAGARLHALPVDDDGAVVDALAEAPHDARMLYLTPSHQYPLGGRLPVQRRLDVLRWAAEHDALVVEDDYDGEFRFGSLPVPALASLDDGARVAYVGTLSKAVAPGLRLGFVVVGHELLDAAVAVRRSTGTPVSGVVQHAMAAYVGGGALRRHVARKRRLYAERRTRLARRLAALDVPIEVRGLEAGLHAVVTLPPDRAAADVVRALGRRGVVVADLDDYRMAPDPAQPGLVLGYGHASAADLDLAVDALAAALRRSDGGGPTHEV